MDRMAYTMMVRTSVQLLSPYPHHSPCAAAQPPRIDEATLVAVQHQMAQQAAFAQIPDGVKRVRPVWRKTKAICLMTHNLNIHIFLLVYRSFPSSSFGKQPRRDNGRLRQRLEPTHGKVLFKN